ncbi:MAG: T9SS type A sorting domain-containing protein [Calditrichaeota bacterium]|nr:T9SS type A sorting domain-containing protein [Calditrichota bacterium]
MKSIQITVLNALIVLLMLVSNAFCQIVYIDDDADLQALVDGNVILFEEQAAGVDYIFGREDAADLNPPALETEYIVLAGDELQIDSGVEIQFSENVILRIEGRMTNGDLGANMIDIDRFPGDDAWVSILIWGDDIDDNDNGIVDLVGCNISGGGAGVADDEGVACWAGLIVMEGEDGDRPELELTDCILNRSDHNGIVVVTDRWQVVDVIDGANITLNSCNINDDDDGVPDLRIQCCGVRIGDHTRVNDDIAAPYSIENDIEITFSQIGHCGIHGFYARYSEGDHDFSNSDFDLSGWRDDLDDFNDDDDDGFFPSERGCGIYFDNSSDLYWGENIEGTIDIFDDCQANSNTWDGIRMNQMSAATTIVETTIDENTGSGIWYDFSGATEDLIIDECVITYNAWDGIFVSHGGLNDTPVRITKNKIHNNQQNTGDQAAIEWGLEVDIAGIRLYGSVYGLFNDPIVIQHNFIDEGNNGISLVRNGAEAPVEPDYVDMYNNIILNTGAGGDQYAGIKVNDYFTEINIINNTVYGYDEGLQLGWECPAQGAGVAEWIYNNLFADCLIGIDDNTDDGLNPTIAFNGFSDNTDDTDGVLEDGSIVVTLGGDFTSIPNDDLHLLYTSPMIDEGDPAAVYDDPDGSDNDLGAYGGPDADFGMLDFEDYVTIPADEEFIIGEQLTLETYGIFADANVLDGRTLIIDAEVVIILMEDAYLNVFGTLDARGAEGTEIIFRPVWVPEVAEEEDESDLPEVYKHFGIYFEGSIDNQIQYIDIWGSDRNGIHMVDDNTFTDFDFVHAHFNDLSGVRINGDAGENDWTVIDITDCEFNNNQHGLRGTEALFAVVIDGSTHDNTQDGYHIFNGGGEVFEFEIFDNLDDGFWIDDSWDAECEDVVITGNHDDGMYIDDDAGCNLFFIITDNGEEDGGNGVYINGGADPWFGGCSIHDNGMDEAEDARSAEIRLIGNGQIGINGARNDIWDEDVNQAAGAGTEYLIYHFDELDYIGGDDTWWGDEDGPEWWWFHPSGNPVNDLNLMTETTFIDFEIEPNIDDANENRMEELFIEARELTKSGHRDRAIPIYRQILANYPTNPRATTAMRKLHGCWLRTGGSLSDIIEYFEDFECPEQAELLSNELFYILAKDYMLNNDYDLAERTLRGRVADPRNIADSLRALIDLEHVAISRLEDENPRISIDGVANQVQYHEGMIELYTSLQESLGTNYPERENRLPDDFLIVEAYPNPFNSSSLITYNLKDVRQIKIAIYDLQGREVTLLHDGQQSAGIHTVTWKATGQSSGVYICKLEAGGISKSIKLTLIQ